VELTTVIVIAFGLAMDAFAVSVTSGIAIRRLRIEHAVRIALFFGSFQAFMPLIGWLAGLGLRGFISQIDHWIAFGLLTLIGCRMIYEAAKLDPKKRKTDPLNTYILLLLAIATSVDALAVGISFAFLKVFIVTPVVIIGIVTFVLSLLGALAGNRLGQLFAKRIEIAGGLVLIGMGVRILIAHLG
jgi:putative Mn2+ efflux pump MntP